MSKIHICRQPIFDEARTVFAYDLLYHSGVHNFFEHIGILSRGKPAFINFSCDLLRPEIIEQFSPKLVMISLRQKGKFEEKVLAGLRKLRELGYTLSVDPVSLGNNLQTILPLARIIRVDYASTSDEQRQSLVEKMGKRGRVKFLLENVQTIGAFSQARQLGYSYFQGHFFSKPAEIGYGEVKANKIQTLRLLETLSKPETDRHEIETILRSDAGLSYKLLRYINSVSFGIPKKIKTIEHAVSMLGISGVRRLLTLIAMNEAADDKPAELMVQCLIRAHFCETLASGTKFKERSPELFLAGLFSLIDAILDQPMADILQQLSLSDDCQNLLLRKNNDLSDICRLVTAYERNDWDEVGHHAATLDLDEKLVAEAYRESVSWADKLTNGNLEE